MVYLDNAATSFPKPRCVLDKTTEFIKKHCGNSGRGSHRLALKTSEKIYEAREKVASFLGISNPEYVVFTQNATHALNLAIKTTIKPNTHVLISDLEHNSVLRPIHSLSEKNNVEYDIFKTDGCIEENIKPLLKDNTRYIVSTLTSNVTGKEIPLNTLSKIAKDNNLKLILDASQALGHTFINLNDVNCDVLCAAGHKALFGIQGVGFALFLDKCERDTIFEGGSGSESFNYNMPQNLPERFEAGTLSAPSIVSLLYGIKFIEDVGLYEIQRKIKDLEKRYVDIINCFDNISLYGHNNGIISFNINNKASDDVCLELNKFGICTRGGFHCSPLAHISIGTENVGAVRLSLSYMNKKSESEKFYKVLKEINDK